VAVYIDDFGVPWRGRRWCHLTADTSDELHEFAARLGIPKRGFHHNPARPWKDHYDLPEAVREEALRLGARPIGRREAARMLREKRAADRTPG
jgi:Protein of unknown function (DUF4031)